MSKTRRLERERYTRLLAILDEAPDEAAHKCKMALEDVDKWRAHIERKLAKLAKGRTNERKKKTGQAGS